METIFENKKQIGKLDIPMQIMRGILFIILVFFVSKIRFINKEMNPNITLIFGIALGILFVYLILSAKTIKRIEKNTETGKLTFIFSRQLRNDKITEINISELTLELKNVQTRANSEKVLLISDQENKVKLSTNQKGITETELNKIINEIESTTHNTVYN
ncbi:hypothetical protein [Winogradskyella vidalii]|uniref:hypothetical protein n=1 Tax=Winogradskyella vidalii TaxID=2615024 RepID=UPI0015C8DACB|nr:hypothetical protein [Winogradskyella vidalii]